ncbi:MAG: hypothetical protein JJU32_07190 [Phormidium sp. BM_Day4_Bin.17]|nr:hypothetical protein [Phormidium sp. BM_Day4_Bin.17]UCJ14140.1 MAG: hypothetical protein JWS08_10740 [Phormidium sp. PBR-2020]
MLTNVSIAMVNCHDSSLLWRSPTPESVNPETWNCPQSGALPKLSVELAATPPLAFQEFARKS